jgi:ABC-type transporter Mla subunit MlaD
VESGNQLVGKSGDTMKEIVTAIKRVNDIMAEIAAASAEQSTGIAEVSTAVSQMDEMTQQNAALVEQAAAAAESLQSQADQLTRRVGQFKLALEGEAELDSNGVGTTGFGRRELSQGDSAKKSAQNPSLNPALIPALSPGRANAGKRGAPGLSLPKASQADEWEEF